MGNKKNIITNYEIRLLLLLTVCFSVCIFFVNNYLFTQKDTEKAETFIEQTMTKPIINIGEGINNTIIEKKLAEHYNAADKVYYQYIPESFQDDSREYSHLFNDFLGFSIIQSKISDLGVEMHQDIVDVRGKMKDQKVKLFGILSMGKEEFLSVGVHEFSHYLDIYFLDKKVFKDLSYFYYDISWESTKVLKPGGKQSDFVSGYAMTNKYEDFAESFTYYVLHNRDFYVKSQKSEILQKKYDFFAQYIFRDGEFTQEDFGGEEKIRDYYRDITKIHFNLDNFLQYLKK